MVRTGASSRFDPGSIGGDLLPDSDASRNIGSSDKRWLTLYAVTAILTALVIGGISLTYNTRFGLVINGSVLINKSLNVTENIYSSDFVQHDGTSCCAAGSGDITSVQGDNVYIYNGSLSGVANLAFNETRLNLTIDQRGGFTDTSKSAIGPYLYNDSSTINFNETRLNITIDQRDGDTLYFNSSFDIAKIPATSHVNFTQNMSFDNDTYLCFGSGGCSDSFIYFNGSTLITKVN